MDILTKEYHKWILEFIHIISLYDSNMVAQFVMKDPEFIHNISLGDENTLSLTSDNKTATVLKEFKENCEKEQTAISKHNYIALFYKYVFAIIIGAIDGNN